MKNDLASGASKSPPGTASSGEADVYRAHAQKLFLSGGCAVEFAENQLVAGQTLSLGPKVVLAPSTALTLADVAAIFHPNAGNKISARSTLVLTGRVTSVKGLDLDGALIVHVAKGSEASIDGLVVKNAGHDFAMLSADDRSVAECLRIRGWQLVKHGELTRTVDGPGHTTLSGTY